MSEFFVLAGPQAAGKTTASNALDRIFREFYPLLPPGKRPALFPLQESRQIVSHKYMLLGAIFMTAEHEQEAVECDFTRMRLLLERNSKRIVYLDECNVFTLAHAKAHGVDGLDTRWNMYIDLLSRLNAKIIFLDLPPNLSWERRREKYRERLIYFSKFRHKSLMRRYLAQLERMYPLFSCGE